MNDYSIGFSEFHYSVRGGALLPLAGAVKIGFKPQMNERSIQVRLLDGSFAVYSEVYDLNEKASIEIISLPEHFLINILGYTRDESGVLYAGIYKPVHFSLFYEERNEGTATRHQLYDVVCTKPDFDASTMTNRLSVDTRRLELVINRDIRNTGYYKRQIRKEDNSELFERWFGLEG